MENIAKEYTKVAKNCVNIPNRLLPIVDVASILGVNRNKVYDLINNGLLKALKLGSLKVTLLELMRFIETYNGKNLDDLDNVKDLKESDK